MSQAPRHPSRGRRTPAQQKEALACQVRYDRLVIARDNLKATLEDASPEMRDDVNRALKATQEALKIARVQLHRASATITDKLLSHANRLPW